MDTGRISLPSIDTMLDTPSPSTTLHLEKTTVGRNKHSYRSPPSQYHPYQQQHIRSPPMESTTWKNHSRSLSLDSPSFHRSLSEQGEPYSVRPSHEGSATSIIVSPGPSQQMEKEKQSSWRMDPQRSQQQAQPSNYHHRRTVSTSYLNANGTDSNNNTLIPLMDSPQRKYMCHQCTKSFSRPSSLRTHIFSHTGEKPFACPYQHCDRTFSVQSNMRRHIRVHYSDSLAQTKPTLPLV
ncbi:hypothetical protein BC941DRAFT_408998 [Chlamydoabsidia padenii]|nr:hypothetical protein BC941DRAFT_408998 [Chlamydoabsidia padenii]